MEPWKVLAMAILRRDRVRADYIHEDRYASLGMAVLNRQPLAFLPLGERGVVCQGAVCENALVKYLPDFLRLEEVLDLL